MEKSWAIALFFQMETFLERVGHSIHVDNNSNNDNNNNNGVT